jgi:predicted RNase H-like nuclease
MSTYIGVDGCKAGWFAISLTDDGAWTHGVYESAEALVSQYSVAKQIYIDIPIGLRNGGSEGRRCDTEARQLLRSPRASSVFTPPARPSISASDYRTASTTNFGLTGRKLSKQAWGIVPKIKEVDELMQSDTKARELLVEVHPELLFWSLNDQRPMQHNKKKPAGRAERIEVLRRYLPITDNIYKDALGSYLRKNVARDDILDALVAAVAGYRSRGNMTNVPEPPEIDPTGLPMRMAIPSFT